MTDDNHEGRSDLLGWSIILMIAVVFIGGLILLQSCTLSFQNIMTSGEAQDVVDTDQAPTTDVSPTITIPAKVI